MQAEMERTDKSTARADELNVPAAQRETIDILLSMG